MKIICFDFDNVIVDGNLLTELGDTISRFRCIKLKTEFILKNTNPRKFFKIINKITNAGKGLKYDDIRQRFLNFEIMKGTRETFYKMKKNGYKIVVVSGNDKRLITDFLKKYKLLKLIDHIYASRLGVKNGRLTGKIYGDVIKTEKVGIIKKLERMYKIKRNEIMYVGDGLTDLPIMKLVGKCILFCPRRITKFEASRSSTLSEKKKRGEFFRIETKNLMEILKFI